jgi:hypothetical protein
MRPLLIAFLLASSLYAQDFGVSGTQKSSRAMEIPAHKSEYETREHFRRRAGMTHKPTRAHFFLWETIEHLRRRVGKPQQYFVPAINRLITPGEYDFYQNTYKKVYDVFYRDSTVGMVRILVAYVKDDSHSRLDPDVRVGQIFFIFDKDVLLRDALNAIYEAQAVCAEGCAMNGFAASVIAQPRVPSESQILLARQMRPQWHGVDMPDASPGLHVFYQDSPYSVDFEHSFVERIDLTLVSNAAQERYSLEVRGKEPTMLNVWRPHRHPSETASVQ